MHVHILFADFGGGDKRVTSVFASREEANKRLAESLIKLAEKDDTTIIGHCVDAFLVYD